MSFKHYDCSVKLNNKKFNIYLGKKIVEGRKRIGMRQLELAHRLGFSRIALSAYETGKAKMTVYQLVETAEIMGLSLNFFLPKEALELSQKTPEYSYDLEEDVEFVLELALRNYLHHKKVSKDLITEEVPQMLQIIEKKAIGLEEDNRRS